VLGIKLAFVSIIGSVSLDSMGIYGYLYM